MADRNASASVNGWIFQICAGVYLFFEDIKNNKSLKIEGQKQDVEIITTNGKKYIQVKCIEKVSNRNSVYDHYKKALESIKECDDGKTELIYFSNIVDPFNTNQSSYYDYGTCFNFDDLTEEVKEKIKSKLGNDFNYDKLSIQIAHFFGDDKSKRRLVEDQISKFLISVGESDSKKSLIYDRLVTNCFFNAANRKKRISKEEFILNLIIPYLNQNMEMNHFEKLTSIDYYEDCLDNYEKYLFSSDMDYSLFLKITSDYKKYSIINKEKNYFDFANDSYEKYLYLVPQNLNVDIATGIIKMLIYRIIQKNRLIKRINEEVGL